ncbi:MAG: hypothetical protein LBV45_07655 [Xanthomonadaceae bacterium]|jgi:sensor domain CHASE-containing protein|nr:hypothetical protein [Xanthomonadaceae bacterium]
MATPTSRSNASRYLIIGVLGIVIGAVVGIMLMRFWQARQDPFPDALMNVIAKQSSILKKRFEANQCTVNDTMPRIQALRYLANDLELAYPSLNRNQNFIRHSSNMRNILDTAIAEPPTDCASLSAFNNELGGSCGACHKEFK